MGTMAWSNDMRCLYCDGKLPLYRKITSGQFCSAAHRKAYWQDQQQLALERLHQTHTSLRAVCPPVSEESILGPSCPEVTELSGFVSDLRICSSDVAARMAEFVDVWETEFGPAIPLWSTPWTIGGVLPEASLIGLMRLWLQSKAIQERDFAPEIDARFRNRLPGVQALAPRMPRPAANFQLCFVPVTSEMAAPAGADAPAQAWLLLLSRLREVDFVLPLRSEAAPLTLLPAIVPYPRWRVGMPAGVSLFASQVALAAVQPWAAPNGPVEGRMSPVESTPHPPVESSVLALVRTLSLRDPSPRAGRGCWYPIEARRSSAFRKEAASVDFPAPSVNLAPLNPPAIIPPDPPNPLDYMVPGVLGMLGLNFAPGTPVTAPNGPWLSNIATIPQPLQTEPILPVAKLEPLRAQRVAYQPAYEQVSYRADPGYVPADGASSSEAPGSSSQAPWKQIPWTHAIWNDTTHAWVVRAATAWTQAPRDLKLLAFAIPALLALAFHGNLPRVRMSGPSSSVQLGQGVQSAVNVKLSSVRQAMMERAAIALDEDFRSGLDDWASRGDATAEWSFDAAGFVKPGPLALYRPSMNLTDYQLQFLGMIDKKALSWVVRAADFDNYYVLKLRVLKPGPRTTLGLTRYAVINGKAQDRVDTPVVMEAQPDTLYRVRLDVDGDNFSLGIQGLMIDSWREPRLAHGGVGFFTARGEESRVRWIALTHQYDMLGRLCAYLAPYEIPTTNGSW